MKEAFKQYKDQSDTIDLIVATDAEGILGIGDWASEESQFLLASWRFIQRLRALIRAECWLLF